MGKNFVEVMQLAITNFLPPENYPLYTVIITCTLAAGLLYIHVGHVGLYIN